MRTRSMGDEPVKNHKYLSLRALEGLAGYQYKSGGLTWMDHVHNPMWNAAVERLPMWLAPNLITLTGTMFVVTAYLFSVFYQPEFQGEELPRWVYWYFGLAVLLYVNLDCMDGKQARRTGTSSPLGQLFDHGCDALSLHLLLDTVRTSLELPGGWAAVGMEMLVVVPWMLAHWEEYHTGMMLYGNGWFGVLEGNYSLMSISFVSAIFGPKVWQHTILPPGTLPSFLEGLNSFRYAMLASVAVMACISGAGQIYRVVIFPTASLPKKEAGNKQLGHGASIVHLFWVCLLAVLGWAYLISTPVHVPGEHLSSHKYLWSPWGQGKMPALLADWGHLVGHARIVGLTWGLVYAVFASQMILSHMSKEPFVPYPWALGVLIVGCANTLLHIAPPLLVDTVLLALTFLGYGHFVSSVILQICEHLGINCLTIKKRPLESKRLR